MLIVFTGNGKGKTSAALGVALRAAGHNMNTLMIQFVKEKGISGEQKICPSILKNIEIFPFGAGFIHEWDDRSKHIEMAEKAWSFAAESLKKKHYHILILDELTVALALGLLSTEKVVKFLIAASKDIHIIITGRNAPPELIKIADIATEMKQISHVYEKGTPAVVGLDF